MRTMLESARSPLLQASATRLASGIRSGEWTSVEVVEAHLARIADVNPALGALVQWNPRARDEAAAADDELTRGEAPGRFHGVPFTVKDVLDVEGIIGAAGLEERSEHRPARDATAVARMRAAGAILLGKTNVPPAGGGGECDNPVYGRTCCPFDFDRTSGGSSGGEAALIAAGGSPLGIGSDSGGSLRLPAHYCGVPALKPTAGRVPATGFFPPFGPMSDPRTVVGPLARSAEDLMPALATLAGPDGLDSSVAPVPLRELADVALPGLRAAFYTSDGVVEPTDETAAAVRVAAKVLEARGVRVAEARPRRVEDAYPVTFSYWRREQLSGPENVESLWQWDRMRRAMLVFLQDWDLVVCPVSATPAVPHGEVGPTTFGFMLPFSLTGWPVAVVPVGRSADGLPIGVQIAAAPWREERAVAAAIALELDRGASGDVRL